jgi:hypothetical protein
MRVSRVDDAEYSSGFRYHKELHFLEGHNQGGTLIHEALHLYSKSQPIREKLGFDGNEAARAPRSGISSPP